LSEISNIDLCFRGIVLFLAWLHPGRDSRNRLNEIMHTGVAKDAYRSVNCKHEVANSNIY